MIGGDSLAVRNADVLKLFRQIAIHMDTGDHQRSKEVALAAFVDTEVRLEHFGVVHLFVAEPGFGEDIRFEAKTHEIFGAASLDYRFGPLLVNSDREFIFLREIERIRTRLELVIFLLQQEPEFGGLRRRQWRSVKGNGFLGHWTDQ